jgi:uncharacterized protein
MSSLNLFPRETAEEFLAWIEESELYTPNDEQKQFIRRYEDRIAVLQGPPGTGKTMTLSYALLARAYALLASQNRMRGMLVAPSNRAVNAALQEVDENLYYWNQHADDTGMSSSLDNLRLIRALGRDIDVDEDLYRETDFVNYHTDDLDQIRQDLTTQTSLGAFTGAANGALVFATTSGGYKFVDEVWDSGTESCFDLLAVDEASMVPTPDMLIPGASTEPDAQVLISGDQRQMPPVQTHDWDREDRRIVEEVAPHLSSMDFFRLFSYQDGFGMDESPEEVEVPSFQNIPIDKLAVTYRCHRVVAEFLRRLIYAQDRIDYRSGREYTLNVRPAERGGVRRVMNPKYPLVLIVHDERESQQSNPYEVGIVDSLVQTVDPDEDVGVVTPHNAQRGRLRGALRNYDNADVDTVERFQGGERDMIVVSGTVSDPDYVRREADFILSPNRLNVAMSRMRKKLVLVVPRSLIDFVPSDSDQYEAARVWKRMYSIVQEEADRAPWTGTISEFAGGVPDMAPDEKLEVFTVSDIETDDGRRSR